MEEGARIGRDVSDVLRQRSHCQRYFVSVVSLLPFSIFFRSFGLLEIVEANVLTSSLICRSKHKQGLTFRKGMGNREVGKKKK